MNLKKFVGTNLYFWLLSHLLMSLYTPEYTFTVLVFFCHGSKGYMFKAVWMKMAIFETSAPFPSTAGQVSCLHILPTVIGIRYQKLIRAHGFDHILHFIRGPETRGNQRFGNIGDWNAYPFLVAPKTNFIAFKFDAYTSYPGRYFKDDRADEVRSMCSGSCYRYLHKKVSVLQFYLVSCPQNEKTAIFIIYVSWSQ